jgi:hypothetical protein
MYCVGLFRPMQMKVETYIRTGKKCEINAEETKKTKKFCEW